MTTDLLESPILASPEEVVMRAFQIMAPPPKLKMSEWADGRIFLSPKVTAEPGFINLSRAPYVIEPMDCIVDPKTEEITAMWAAQCAKTLTFIDIPTAYYMHQDPSRITLFFEDEDKQKSWSVQRLSPMIDGTDCLRELVSHKGGPDSKNTIDFKDIPGGYVAILNSGSAADLSSRASRIVGKDEIDKWKMLAAGDPDSLADKRAQNSFNKKIINVSTPRDHNPDQKIYSRITIKYEASDKRKYYVPCPFCRHEQVLREEQLKFIDRSGDELGDAKYECEKCKMLISHMHKERMLKPSSGAKWIAEKPFKGHAGFWLNALYSPWITWKEYGEAKIKMVRQHDTHKTFQNEWRALPWNPMIEYAKDISPYLVRREYYEKVPMQTMPYLTAMVDIQKDRIEVDVRAWGISREVWGIEHRIFWGETAKLTTGYLPPVWQELEAFRQKTWEHESGEVCHISRMFIDMGYLQSEVLRFCKGKRPMVWPCKGMSDINSKHPLVSTRPTMDKKGRFKYFQIGPNEGKDIIAANLSAEPPKEAGQSVPGYMHFNQTYDEDYFKQLLVSEIQKRVNGILVWRKITDATPNEALDLSVGNLACFESMNTDPKPYVEAMRKNYEVRIQKESGEDISESEIQDTKPQPRNPPRRNGGWVKGWRK